MTTVAKFSIEYHQFIDENGQPTTSKLPAFAKDSDYLRSLYEQMHSLRVFDAKAYALQRTGNMGTYPASLGQEAIGVGYGAAMKKEDVLVPYYRSMGGLLSHGVSMTEILQYWGGYELGSDFKEAREDFPLAIPIATQCLNAAGVATAFKMRDEKRAAVTEIGEGGTSKGDFYEALNVAGIWNLGVLFMVNNNQWAISVPSRIQTATETYAQKAIAAGVKCLQVDGNDIVAVHHFAKEALKRARNGKGPTLIEAITYRLCDHTTADDANRYRPSEEMEEARKKEPLIRLRRYLESLEAWSDKDEEAMQARIAEKVEQAVKEYNATPKQSPATMFDYMYEELPKELEKQKQYALERGPK